MESLIKMLLETERLEEAEEARKTNAMCTHHASFLESVMERESLSEVETTDAPRESLFAWFFRHETLDDSSAHPPRLEKPGERSPMTEDEPV